MDKKNLFLFVGIFSLMLIGGIALFFLTGGFSKKTPATGTAANNPEFPSADGSTKNSGSLFNFNFFGSNDQPSGIDSTDNSSSTLTQSQYDYYSGTPTPTPTTPNNTVYPIQPKFDNTTGNPDTGYKPNPDDSIYKGMLALESVNSVYDETGDPATEYVVIVANDQNTKKIQLTGMVLKSMITGVEYPIGGAASLYFRNTVNPQTTVFLKPGDYAYVISGRSPVGSSFESNKCIGYLAQFQDFYPALSNNCPLIYYEGLPERPNALNDNCLDYVGSFPACIAPTSDYQQPIIDSFGPECFSYVNTKANYSYCVNKHKNEPDFFEPAWHIYLSQDQHIWKTKREWVRLLDANGKIVSEVSY